MFYHYEKAEAELKARLKNTMISTEEFKHATTEPPSRQTKAIPKRINEDAEKAEVSHQLRLNHSEILERLIHTHTHPMWRHPSPIVATYTSWLAGATGTNQDKPREGDKHKPYRLCESGDEESREHLLTRCDGTFRSTRPVSREVAQNIEEQI